MLLWLAVSIPTVSERRAVLTGVARHDREGKGQGDAPRAGLCSQAVTLPFPPS